MLIMSTSQVMMLLLFWFLRLTDDVIQSYVLAMPSPKPKIEPLLVQAGFQILQSSEKLKLMTL